MSQVKPLALSFIKRDSLTQVFSCETSRAPPEAAAKYHKTTAVLMEPTLLQLGTGKKEFYHSIVERTWF